MAHVPGLLGGGLGTLRRPIRIVTGGQRSNSAAVSNSLLAGPFDSLPGPLVLDRQDRMALDSIWGLELVTTAPIPAGNGDLTPAAGGTIVLDGSYPLDATWGLDLRPISALADAPTTAGTITTASGSGAGSGTGATFASAIEMATGVANAVGQPTTSVGSLTLLSATADASAPNGVLTYVGFTRIPSASATGSSDAIGISGAKQAPSASASATGNPLTLSGTAGIASGTGSAIADQSPLVAIFAAPSAFARGHSDFIDGSAFTPSSVVAAPDSLLQTWINPYRNSMDETIASAFDSLEEYLRGPQVMPAGVVIGNGTSLTPPSVTFPFGPDGVPPGAITGLAVTGGVRSLVLRWNNVTDVDVFQYDVQVDTSPTFSTPTSRTAGGNSSVVTDLIAGTTYYCRVRAVDQWGTVGAWTGTVTGTPSLVGTIDLASGAITADKIAANAITADKIAANSIYAGALQANSVTAAALAANSVTASAIAANSITASMIQAGSINSTKIAVNGVDINNIIDGAVTNAKLGAWAVTNAKIAPNTITAASIAADTITANEIAASTITASELAALTLEVGKFIRSSNYVANVSGWAIDASGSAEFENVFIRGTIDSSTITGSTITGGIVRTASSGQYVAMESGDQDTLRFYTGVGMAEINAASDRLQMLSPNSSSRAELNLVSSGQSYIGQTMVQANAAVLMAEADMRAKGSIQSDNNVKAFGLYLGNGPNQAAQMQMSSSNKCHFYWDGTNAWIVIDGASSFQIT